MFKTVQARFALRCFLYGVGGFCVSLKASSLGTTLTWHEVLIAVLDGVMTGIAYSGIGFVFPQVEPNIGNKKKES